MHNSLFLAAISTALAGVPKGFKVQTRYSIEREATIVYVSHMGLLRESFAITSLELEELRFPFEMVSKRLIESVDRIMQTTIPM